MAVNRGSVSTDHDACGVGFIARLGSTASREVVERALEALLRLSHRGGVLSPSIRRLSDREPATHYRLCSSVSLPVVPKPIWNRCFMYCAKKLKRPPRRESIFVHCLHAQWSTRDY